ncbi:pilus assembly protein TadG-related protein [Streptomyces griseus]|uniref:pilus assembly protein TadG-related protein n=1 Tax=Streptomyces griseus TaxID=1911 RepID=UPI00055A7D24|nr:pilus assembly protein TadG-related protein [Streptomyces griseus]
MPARRCSDAGQAFPIYITVVAGLLFLAFAYLAVGQGAVNRNGAQTAADAAALAAAQDTRDQLAGQWLRDLLDPAKWQDSFDGKLDHDPNSCPRAYQLAELNDADGSCEPDGPLAYKVVATAKKPVGDSIVPGTEGIYATAEARAVIEPLCDKPPSQPAGSRALPQLTCKGSGKWTPDPADSKSLPKPEDLFDVHLAD